MKISEVSERCNILADTGATMSGLAYFPLSIATRVASEVT